MRFAAMMLAAAVLATAPAFAQTAPVEPAAPGTETAAVGDTTETADASVSDPDEEIICRTVQRAESRLRTRRERVCGTRTQWETMADQNARDARGIGAVNPPSRQ